MDKKEILSKVDHTLLAQTATWEEIKQILDDGMKYETASACIPGSPVLWALGAGLCLRAGLQLPPPPQLDAAALADLDAGFPVDTRFLEVEGDAEDSL